MRILEYQKFNINEKPAIATQSFIRYQKGII